jgi:S-adenosylmethionine hydrolase
VPPRYDTVTFLSDYGTDDEFVGVVHSVIRSIAPHAAVVDLTHGIPAHDVRAGGLTLARSAQYVAPGVILAVVDPGVGTDRRAVAVEVLGGRAVFVGPDNGLLASAVAMVGGAERAVSLTNPEYQLPAPGATFAGRDVFAPAAAHLANGVPLDELGDVVDPLSLLPGLLPITKQEGEALVAEVLWVDHYGNAQLNVDPEEAVGLGERVALRANDTVRTTVRADTYGAIPKGQIGLVVDSYGLLSVCVDRGSAAFELGLAAGSEVTLEPAGPASTPVTFRTGGDA